jgi:NTE family protein
MTAASRRAVLALAGAALAGCTLDPLRDHRGPDAPALRPLNRPVRMAWVFSSGGPRGLVHVGVVKALDELGLVPDLIVGASAGAVVGVLRAAGLRGPAIESLALQMRPTMLMRLARVGETWLGGEGLADWVRDCVAGRALQDLGLPVACVARRPQRGDVVAFNWGDAGLAVQASAAIEGQFAPVRIRGDLYADADLQQPLPVRLARALGAQRVLAVDASAHEGKAPPGTDAWRPGDLRKRALTQPDAQSADLLLHPDTGYYAGFSPEYRARTIEIGYRATLAAADRLRALHAA